jgi:molybdopterin/thiamine biosynthesis adenylyltransferase
MKPQFLDYSQLEKLRSQHSELIVDDHIDLAIDELFDIDYPAKKDSKDAGEVTAFGEKLTNKNPSAWGEWVYYSWLNKVVHFPPVKELRALRTSRNRNLVTAEEQQKLYNATILVIGMSVGSNIVEALVSQGIGSRFLLVDMDIIEPSNLNRIRAPYHHVGLHKVEAISRKVWEIDPYIEVTAYNDGLSEMNLVEILQNGHVDIIVDEMDDLRMKIVLRESAKAHKLPVVMAADDGDDTLLETERYDLNADLQPFGGRIPQDILDKIKVGGIPRAELGVMIGRYFVGPEHIPLRMYESLMEVGKTLPSWPQLGSAAALSGISVAFVIKKILLGQKVRDGRVLVSLDEKLDLERLDEQHKKKLQAFQHMMSGAQGDK